MKHKTENQIATLIKKFPVIGLIRFAERYGNGKLPKTDIHIQRADPGTMHLQAKNCWYSGRAYIGGKGDLRGTKSEYVIAVDRDGKPLTYLEWEKGNFETTLKDIFSEITFAEVDYLAWVSTVRWFTPSSQEREEKTGGNLFDEFVEGEVDVIIFQEPNNQTFEELITIADHPKKQQENAHKFLPKIIPEFPNIYKGLKNGGRIHAFQSGGGLRVAYMRRDDDDNNMGYGEHPHIEEALNHLEEDLLAGGREYKDVYGGLYPHYLTGESIATSNPDSWILQGHTFDCWLQNTDEVVVVLKGSAQTKTPKNVVDSVKELDFGEAVLWNERGFKYATSKYEFPNGDVGFSTKKIEDSEGARASDAFMYRIHKTVVAKSFWEAVKKAFEAPEIEAKE